jgi:hypothetical protein
LILAINHQDATQGKGSITMKKNRVFYLLGILMIGLCLIVVLPFMKDQLDDIDYTSEVTPIDLRLGDTSFVIPKAYLWYKPNWAGKAENAIHITVTLPGLQPYSEATKIYYKGGPALKYKVSIDLYKMQPKERFEDTYFKPQYLKNCAKKWGNFKVCPFIPQPNLFEVLVQEQSEIPLAFICPALGTQSSPFCQMEIPYGSRLKLKIGLHENQLGDAVAIIKDVYRLLEDFSN